MKHIVKEIQKYLNFNEGHASQVQKINFNEQYSAGICQYKEEHNYSHFIDEATFTYVVKGHKYMLIDKKEFDLQAGDLLFIPAKSVVFTDIKKTEGIFESFNCVVTNEVLKNFGFKSSPLKKNPFVFAQNKNVIHNYFTFLNSYSFEKTNENSRKLFYQLLKMLLDFCKDESETTLTKKKIYEEKIHIRLLEFIYQPIGLEQMALQNNMSLASFKRKFKDVYGMSPKTWIRNVRLQAAYFHLKTSHSKVSEVSSFVGFQNFPHFSYAFKKYFKISPSSLN